MPIEPPLRTVDDGSQRRGSGLSLATLLSFPVLPSAPPPTNTPPPPPRPETGGSPDWQPHLQLRQGLDLYGVVRLRVLESL